ncbi:MAG: CYTH domain-containing protein [Magnetococcales bacterium]|nr:CYTH domain-containing protein [Magnetococcales bacterium]
MAIEIERRFLVNRALWQKEGLPLALSASAMRQGFLSTVKERVVRVRLVDACGTLTIKGLTRGFAKAEFEYAIPRQDAEQLLDALCEQTPIEKIRYRIEQEGVLWEVDEFLGANQGLLLAEVELTGEDQKIVLPSWIAQEVSDDPRYFNSSLSMHPFNTWEKG